MEATSLLWAAGALFGLLALCEVFWLLQVCLWPRPERRLFPSPSSPSSSSACCSLQPSPSSAASPTTISSNRFSRFASTTSSLAQEDAMHVIGAPLQTGILKILKLLLPSSLLCQEWMEVSFQMVGQSLESGDLLRKSSLLKKQFFRLCDRTKSGDVSEAEVVMTFAMFRGWIPDALSELLDLDGDGSVGLKEFVDMLGDLTLSVHDAAVRLVNEAGKLTQSSNMFMPGEEEVLWVPTPVAETYMSHPWGSMGLSSAPYAYASMRDFPSDAAHLLNSTDILRRCGDFFDIQSVSRKMHAALHTIPLEDVIRRTASFLQRHEEEGFTAAQWNEEMREDIVAGAQAILVQYHKEICSFIVQVMAGEEESDLFREFIELLFQSFAESLSEEPELLSQLILTLLPLWLHDKSEVVTAKGVFQVDHLRSMLSAVQQSRSEEPAQCLQSLLESVVEKRAVCSSRGSAPRCLEPPGLSVDDANTLIRDIISGMQSSVHTLLDLLKSSACHLFSGSEDFQEMLAETLGECDMLTPSPSVDNFSALAAASSSSAANSGTPSTPVTPRRRRRNRMSINLKKLEVTLPKGALEGVEGLEGSF